MLKQSKILYSILIFTILVMIIQNQRINQNHNVDSQNKLLFTGSFLVSPNLLEINKKVISKNNLLKTNANKGDGENADNDTIDYTKETGQNTNEAEQKDVSKETITPDVETKATQKTNTANKKKENTTTRSHSYSNIVKSLSKNDISMLERIVEAEATGGDIQSKTHIASVILNRIQSDEFPDTVEGVIFQRNGNTVQFAPIKDGRYYKVNITEETKQAVKYVLENGDTAKNALYFCNEADIKTNWFNTLDRLFKDDLGHTFFK